MRADAPFRPRNRPRRYARVSLTPLIDVVFILLVFFMLASSFVDWRALSLSAAGGGAAAPTMKGAFLVDVGPGGALRLAGAPIGQGALLKRLGTAPDRRVLLRPIGGVAVQPLVDLIDRLEGAGVARVALLPAPEEPR